MSPVNLFWIILYAVSALTFFAVAFLIAVFGIRDLKSLLSKAEKKNGEDR